MTLRHTTSILSCAFFTLAIGCSPLEDKDRSLEGTQVDVVEPAAQMEDMTPKSDATTAENLQVNQGDDEMEVVVEKEVK